MAQQVVLVDNRRGSSQKSLKRLAGTLNKQVATLVPRGTFPSE